MPDAPKNLRHFDSFVQVVQALRGPQGCPWDLEQTHQTLARFALEEAAELADALIAGRRDEILEELGDLLLQVVLNAEIARQSGLFDINDVIESIGTKMVRRHPHVFGDQPAKDSAEVLANWDVLKAQEKQQRPQTSFGLSPQLSALIASHKIGEKSARVKFDWDSPEQVMAKVEEEFEELKGAMAARLADHAANRDSFNEKTLPTSHALTEATLKEAGDLLFSVAQLIRHLGADAEQVLRSTNQRFTRRFFRMKELIDSAQLKFEEMPAQEKEPFWRRAKEMDGTP